MALATLVGLVIDTQPAAAWDGARYEISTSYNNAKWVLGASFAQQGSRVNLYRKYAGQPVYDTEKWVERYLYTKNGLNYYSYSLASTSGFNKLCLSVDPMTVDAIGWLELEYCNSSFKRQSWAVNPASYRPDKWEMRNEYNGYYISSVAHPNLSTTTIRLPHLYRFQYSGHLFTFRLT